MNMIKIPICQSCLSKGMEQTRKHIIDVPLSCSHNHLSGQTISEIGIALTVDTA